MKKKIFAATVGLLILISGTFLVSLMTGGFVSIPLNETIESKHVTAPLALTIPMPPIQKIEAHGIPYAPPSPVKKKIEQEKVEWHCQQRELEQGSGFVTECVQVSSSN